jgi:hypothetical protein
MQTTRPTLKFTPVRGLRYLELGNPNLIQDITERLGVAGI